MAVANWHGRTRGVVSRTAGAVGRRIRPVFGLTSVPAAALVAGVVTAPVASADDGPVVTEYAGVRCLVTADAVGRGGGPMVICQHSDGQPFAQSPWDQAKHAGRLNLVVVRGTGEMYWDKGSVTDRMPAPSRTIELTDGQAVHVDGWTIEVRGKQTFYTWDASRHGLAIDTVEARQY